MAFEARRLEAVEEVFGIAAATRLMAEVVAPWVQDLGILVEAIESGRPAGAPPDWQPGAVRALAWIGSLSYSLYLLHQNLGVALIQKATAAGLSDLAAILAVSVLMIGLAHASFRFIEKPGARWVMTMHDRWREHGWRGVLRPPATAAPEPEPPRATPAP